MDELADAPGKYDGLDVVLKSGRGPRWMRAAFTFLATAISASPGGAAAFVMSCFAGAVSSGAALWGEKQQDDTNKVLAACAKEMAADLEDLKQTVARIVMSISASEEQFAERVEDPRYQNLIRKAFTGWSRAQSEEKREMIRRLLSHAADLPNPDYHLLNLFFDWVRRYNELHFRLIRSLSKLKKATRLSIWNDMGGVPVRDDSPEAEVFDCLMLDLTFGHILRIERFYDHYTGRKLKKERRPRGEGSPYMKAALDDEDVHELTLVGTQFVHHTMDEIISKLPPAPPRGV